MPIDTASLLPSQPPVVVDSENFVQTAYQMQPFQNLNQVPQNVTQVMPTIFGATSTVIPDSNQDNNVLTPESLLRPLPSIVSTDPSTLAPACSSFSDYIGNNPMIGIGILGLFAWFMLGKKSS